MTYKLLPREILNKLINRTNRDMVKRKFFCIVILHFISIRSNGEREVTLFAILKNTHLNLFTFETGNTEMDENIYERVLDCINANTYDTFFDLDSEYLEENSKIICDVSKDSSGSKCYGDNMFIFVNLGEGKSSIFKGKIVTFLENFNQRKNSVLNSVDFERSLIYISAQLFIEICNCMINPQATYTAVDRRTREKFQIGISQNPLIDYGILSIYRKKKNLLYNGTNIRDAEYPMCPISISMMNAGIASMMSTIVRGKIDVFDIEGIIEE